MIIFGIDYNDYITYFYEDTKNKSLDRVKAYDLIIKNKLVDGNRYFDHLLIIKKDLLGIFYFFFEDITNTKEGRYRSKILAKGISQLFVISDSNQKNLDTIEDTVFHNTKNIIHYLANGIKKLINYDQLLLADNKVEFINTLIKQNSMSFAREVLACNKSLEQISFEYNILDYIKPNTEILESDRTKVKIHSLLVQAFYIYEQSFTDKNIKVSIGKDYSEIRTNFFTMRSAFALIMENCAKYCMSNSDIEIDIDRDRYGNIKIDLSMMSIYNTDYEISEIFLQSKRSEEAMKKESGNGLGLFITKRLLNINGIEIQFKRLSNSIRIQEEIKYCNNLFIIDIPNSFVIS